MRPRRLRHLLAPALACLALAGAGSAQAQSISTFIFQGDCTDCAAEAGLPSFPVAAVLQLADYTEGAAISTSNFAALLYGGSNLVDPFSLSFAGDDGNPATRDFNANTILQLSGSLNTQSPTTSSFLVVFDDGLHFRTQGDGSFTLCAPKGSDYYGGNSCDLSLLSTDQGTGAWVNANPVPEPATWGLWALGLAGLGLWRRRR